MNHPGFQTPRAVVTVNVVILQLQEMASAHQGDWDIPVVTLTHQCDRVSGTVLCDISLPGCLGHAVHVTMTFCLNCSLGLFHKCLWKRKIQRHFSILCFRSNRYWLTHEFEFFLKISKFKYENDSESVP